MSDGQESDSFDRFWNHRPRMTYEGLSLVFNKVGDLVIDSDADGTGSQVTIPEWQLDLVLSFIKRHRLAPMQAGIAGAFSRRTAGESQGDGEDQSGDDADA
jgi:hypothetical protein